MTRAMSNPDFERETQSKVRITVELDDLTFTEAAKLTAKWFSFSLVGQPYILSKCNAGPTETGDTWVNMEFQAVTEIDYLDDGDEHINERHAMAELEQWLHSNGWYDPQIEMI